MFLYYVLSCNYDLARKSFAHSWPTSKIRRNQNLKSSQTNNKTRIQTFYRTHPVSRHLTYSAQTAGATSIGSTSKSTKSRYSPSNTVANSPTGASWFEPLAFLAFFEEGESDTAYAERALTRRADCFPSGYKGEVLCQLCRGVWYRGLELTLITATK